jgi:hypothetical protein
MLALSMALGGGALAEGGGTGDGVLYVPSEYPTIQAAVNAADPGDTILVASGTYPEQVVIPAAKAGITIQGDGSYPQIRPALNTASKYDTVIMVQAANVTIRGLDISNALGVVDTGGNPGGTHIEHHAIWDGAWTLGAAGLTVDDCRIHDIEHGVRSYGPNLTVTNCEMYSLRRSGVHASGPYQTQPLSMSVHHNWFHDWHDYYKEGAAVHVKYDSRVGEVAYNYISGMRMGIAYYDGGPKAGYGQQIVFHHNTIDLDYDPGSGPVVMTMGVSLYGTNTDADYVVIRDNIFANARWYGVYQEDGEETIQGSFTVDNNLFYNNYWDYWPDYQYPFQWFGDDTRAQAGWLEGPGTGFTFTKNITTQDPLFALAGVGPQQQWALTCGSPAYHTASDGTNIGAWQGTLVCDDQGPVTSNVVATPNSAGVGTAVALTATVDDTTTGGSNIASAEYSLDGGLTWSPMSAADGAFDEPAEDVGASVGPFSGAGLYDVCVRGTDAATNTGSAQCILLVVYDPGAGFVTGGGWIDSPAGAYPADPALTGKATFGFVCKYLKHGTVPKGETAFVFRVFRLNFYSTSYDWLVVARPRAWYMGKGRVRGVGDCRFMASLIDGDLPGGDGIDRFRIRIWDPATGAVIYDNQPGAPDFADPTTVLAGGSIVIHK